MSSAVIRQTLRLLLIVALFANCCHCTRDLTNAPSKNIHHTSKSDPKRTPTPTTRSSTTTTTSSTQQSTTLNAWTTLTPMEQESSSDNTFLFLGIGLGLLSIIVVLCLVVWCRCSKDGQQQLDGDSAENGVSENGCCTSTSNGNGSNNGAAPPTDVPDGLPSDFWTDLAKANVRFAERGGGDGPTVETI